MRQLRGHATIIILGLGIAGCGAPALREAAAARLPLDGPVAAARAAEAAAAGRPDEPAVRPLPSPLSIDACIAWALEHNRDLRAQISASERSRLDITSAWSTQYAPRLSATGEQRTTRRPTGTTESETAQARVALATNLLGFTLAPYASGSWTGAEDDDTPYGAAVGIALSRRIFALAEDIRLSAQLTRADRAFAQSVNSLTLRTRRTALDAARAFFDLQRTETRLRLRETRVEQARAFLAGVREAVAAGLKAPLEETNAVIDFNQAEANLLADRQSLANARDRLMSLLDRPLGGEVAIEHRDVTDVVPGLPPLADDIALVLRGHEDLRNLAIDQDAARDELRLALDRLAPQVTATASAAREWESERAGGTDEAADVVALRIELDMPLDGWSGDRAALRRQERTERELRLRQRGLQTDLERQVRELRRRIDSQVRSVDLSRQRLDAERAKFAATEASYRTGRLDNLELTRARESLDRAEVELLEARIDLVLALAEREALLPPEPAP